MASIGFKKRKNIGAAKQRTGITSTKSAQGVGDHAEEYDGEDAKESNLIDVKASSSSSSTNGQTRETEGSMIATTFESSRNAMPQSYAGDANNASRQEIEVNKGGGVIGPQKAPEFVRMTCRFDYQPDICKDYKETGFCGYGDNCKFMHDRGDYKSGWQLEREWDEAQARKKKRLEESLKGFDFEVGENNQNDGEDDEEEENWEIDLDEELPFACLICRGEFEDPVVTLCGHYFCSKCAIARHQKHPKCAACAKQTMGVFNVAQKIIKQMAVRDSLKKKSGSTGECVEIKTKIKGTWG